MDNSLIVKVQTALSFESVHIMGERTAELQDGQTAGRIHLTTASIAPLTEAMEAASTYLDGGASLMKKAEEAAAGLSISAVIAAAKAGGGAGGGSDTDGGGGTCDFVASVDLRRWCRTGESVLLLRKALVEDYRGGEEEGGEASEAKSGLTSTALPSSSLFIHAIDAHQLASKLKTRGHYDAACVRFPVSISYQLF
jgi:hypothetical protein